MIKLRTFASEIALEIGSAAFCDNGTELEPSDIAAALDVDRGAGFRDPTPDEVTLLVEGDDNGIVPTRMRAEHPALYALLAREMT